MKSSTPSWWGAEVPARGEGWRREWHVLALAAKAALEGLLQRRAWVTLSTRSKTADGVELAEIIPVGSTLPINLCLVQVGLAALDRQAASPCNQEIYREAELRVRTMQFGLWRPSPGIRSRQP